MEETPVRLKMKPSLSFFTPAGKNKSGVASQKSHAALFYPVTQPHATKIGW